ncbi:MAG: manganese efflux pump [Bacteroidales bacterium]|nr:manganese efflux pump [Bacteroidales bacterium]
MNFFSYILFGLSMGLIAMLTFRACTLHTKIQLSRGLAYSFLLASVQTLFLLFGIWFGSLWRFSTGNLDSYVFVGIMLLLAAKLSLNLFDKKNGTAYDISRFSTLFLLSIALGINDLIGGMGIGFLAYVQQAWLIASLPLFLLVFLLSYLGIMLGRRNIEIKQRRWTLFAVLFVLVAIVMVLL